MHRSVGIGIAVLTVLAAGLWGLDVGLERRAQARLLHDSRHVRIGGETTTVEAVNAFELSIPGADAPWRYRRDAIGWRLPGFQDGYADTRRVDAILGAVIDGRGTWVGRRPADAERFGLTETSQLTVRLLADDAQPLDSVRVGRVAAGKKAGESFMTREGHDAIYHVAANPWPAVDWTPGAAYPPLLDRRLIPGALGRRSVRNIRFEGSFTGAFRFIERVDLEPDPGARRRPDEGPRHEWYGTTDRGVRRQLEDRPAYQYASQLVQFPYQSILERAAGSQGDRMLCRLILTYDGEETPTDTLEIYRSSAGEFSLANLTTDQLFGLDAETAGALVPAPGALPFSNP